MLLARLAVDTSAQGCGLGHKLLIHALGEIAKASLSVGFEVVVVHAIDAEAVTFYTHAGFIRFEGNPLHLYLPTEDVLATLDSIQV